MRIEHFLSTAIRRTNAPGQIVRPDSQRAALRWMGQRGVSQQKRRAP